MAQHRVLITDTRHYTVQNPENHELGIARVIIGMIAYMVFIAPIFSFLLVSSLNLSGAYITPVIIILLIAGMYVTEKYYCRNNH